MNLSIEAPARLGQSSLPDGRLLGWAEWGSQEGIPVLLCPAAATSRWLGLGTDIINALGVRLVSVDRPGLGVSDPDPDRTLDDWANDVRHLVALRELERLRVVGFSQGAPFALACAAHGVAVGAAIVSGGDELAAPEFADALVPEVRAIVNYVATDPAGAETFFAESGSAAAMWEMIIAGSPDVDRVIYQQPSFEAVFRLAMVEAFSQGPAGYARDTVLHMGRWPFALADITVPVDLWYGQQDTSRVHSPDLGATLEHRLPSARRHVVPDAGSALLWTHNESILRSLLQQTGKS